MQLLVTVLGQEADRKVAADDFRLFSASLRFHHTENHFRRMVAEMQTFTSQLMCDGKPFDILKLLLCFGASELSWDGHVARARIEAELASLHVQLLPRDSQIALTDVPKDAPLMVAPPSEVELFMLPFVKYLQENQLRLVDVFRALDRDQSGSITKEEFALCLKKEALPISEDRIDALIEGLDLDGDGMIDYQEFSMARNEAVEGERDRKRMHGNAGSTSGDASLSAPASAGTARSVGSFIAGASASASATQRGVSASSSSAPPLPAPSSLSFGFEDLAELALHCHYVTRP